MSRNFTYIAYDTKGRKTHGTIEAESRDQAIDALRRQGLFATQINEPSENMMPSEARAEGFQWIFDFFGFTFVSQKSMAVYTRKFAGMINAGLNYGDIFDILSQETENARLRNISKEIRDDIINGNKVEQALSKHPNVFTKVYRSMVQAGEATGRLDNIMNELADMYDREHELRSKVMSRLYFPIIYLIVGLIIVSFIIFVLPSIITTAYPLVHRSIYIQVLTFWFVIIALILIGRTKPGYRFFRTLISYIPPFYGLLRKMSLARFCRLFAAMYSAGVPVMTGLDIAGETMVEPDLQIGLAKLKENVNNGESLTTAFASSYVFPKSLRGMVRAGEVAGSVEKMMTKAAEYYEIEIEGQSSMLSSIFVVAVLVIVLGTFAIFIIHMWSNYFGFIESFMNE